MEEQIFKFIQETVYSVTGKKGLVYDTDFVKDLELNSFDIMNIICVFEDHFDVEIPNRDVWHLRHRRYSYLDRVMDKYGKQRCMHRFLLQ